MSAPDAEKPLIWGGRCRSGKRWFWCAIADSYLQQQRRCDDPVCRGGITGHEYGWTDTEAEAIGAYAAARDHLAGKPWPGG